MPTQNANIPRIGFRIWPPADSTNRLPTNGPVQENETRTSVNAMKKMPIKPPLSACLSALFTHELGKVISKSPKKDNANTTKTTKNNRFGIQLVASSLAISGPINGATIEPTRVYIKIIENPYMRALRMPTFLLLALPVKKVTVIGIIGKTQGVKRATKPAKNAPIIKVHSAYGE
jgi:hypothetical protein